MICAPTPPPTIPAIVLPMAPKSYCFSAEPATFPPTAPATSWMIRPTIPLLLVRVLSTILGVTSSIDVLTQLRGFYTYRSKFPERCSLGWLRGYEMRDGRLTISW
jgi:hypothetical protein